MRDSMRELLPGPGTLSGDAVHLYRVDVSLPSYRAEIPLRVLSGKEREKAGQFRCGADRDRFIAARGFLKILLGHYLDAEPENLAFRRGPHGKPALDAEFVKDSIRFSVSHSGRMVLCAVARGREIGVDVESVRRDFPCDPISERYFSHREAACLAALPPGARQEAFFT